MKIVKPSHEILFWNHASAENIMLKIEHIARVCYKSEDKIGPGTAVNLIHKFIDLGHEAMIEHCAISVKFICDRGVSHELVRHRLAAFAQESTRYCNYGDQDKFNHELTFIAPCFWEKDSIMYNYWLESMQQAETHYLTLISCGASPQQARSVLPNSLKTELVVTANLREWRHIFKMRCSRAAHPQMVELMLPLLEDLGEKLPVIFGDYEVANFN